MNLDKKKITHNFNKAANTYDKYVDVQPLIAKDLFKLIKAKIKPGCKILDLGCGTGELSKLIHKNFDNITITQLDSAINMCFIAKEKFTLDNIICADINYLPFKANYFDIIISSMSLQWVNNYEEIFIRIKNIAKPTALIAISLPGKNSFYDMNIICRNLGSAQFTNKFLDQKTLYNITDKVFEKNIDIFSKKYFSYYNNFLELLKYFKKIGAATKDHSNFLKLSSIKNINNHYNSSHETKKLNLDWDIIFIIIDLNPLTEIK